MSRAEPRPPRTRLVILAATTLAALTGSLVAWFSRKAGRRRRRGIDGIRPPAERRETAAGERERGDAPAMGDERPDGPGDATATARAPESAVNLEALHLPGPSLAPVIFAAGITFLLFGVVTHWVFTLVGAFLLVVGLTGWIRELRRGHE